MVEMLYCRKCGQDKEACSDNFYWITALNKWQKPCKVCNKERSKRTKSGNSKYSEFNFVIDNINFRKCRDCENLKELSEDNFYYREKIRFSNICIICAIKKQSEYYLDNKEERLLAGKKWRQDNPEKYKNQYQTYNGKETTKENNKKYRVENRKQFRLKEKEWREKNPEKAKEIARRKGKIQQQKLHNKLKSSISSSISKMIKSNNSSKNGESILKYLPWSFEEFKIYIESLFESWMNWENRGVFSTKKWKDDDQSTWVWHIDHIIPHSEFPYSSMEEDNFKKAWALSNLRPYNAKLNCLDGSNRTRHSK